MTRAKIYKVVVPSLLAWPPGNVILTTTFLEEDAQKYINEYPNLWLQGLMKIESELVTFHETD